MMTSNDNDKNKWDLFTRAMWSSPLYSDIAGIEFDFVFILRATFPCHTMHYHLIELQILPFAICFMIQTISICPNLTKGGCVW